jgi:hypoxanthine phosphoribosyltransferase
MLSWADISGTCSTIASQVTADGLPDVIICLIRGGMIPGVLLSHALGCRDLRGLSLTHTCADGIDTAKTSRPVLSNPGSAGDVRGRDVLLVDDVAGTGETALAAVIMISDRGAARTRIAVCAVNTRNWTPAASDPGECLDYIGGRYRGWVVFPWEQ